MWTGRAVAKSEADAPRTAARGSTHRAWIGKRRWPPVHQRQQWHETMRETIEDVLREIIAKQAHLDPSAITPEPVLSEIGVTSLDLVRDDQAFASAVMRSKPEISGRSQQSPAPNSLPAVANLNRGGFARRGRSGSRTLSVRIRTCRLDGARWHHLRASFFKLTCH